MSRARALVRRLESLDQMGEYDYPRHPKRLENPNASCPLGTRQDINLLLKAAWFQGCWIVRGGNEHFKIYTPDGAQMIPIPATPSGYKTLKNKRGQLKRAGIDPNLRK